MGTGCTRGGSHKEVPLASFVCLFVFNYVFKQGLFDVGSLSGYERSESLWWVFGLGVHRVGPYGGVPLARLLALLGWYPVGKEFPG